ncbi:MAG: dipeptidase [Armatimonadota bacterium]|nr:dipeptidase [Armatimonadota bacterium]MDR7451170.1 dipeptidase [Armatimonadota bacterium]MDR7467225.1 dipeptidase [Armatimonadota bacterium]MDR7494847.1 dipeptidase [Armatimonadota bacterium]MDR7500260.1 dipeptidase [Armatimonadota bacterium]
MNARAYARDHRDRFLEELKDLVRIPSVSALPAHRDDVRGAAQWLLEHLRGVGLTGELIPIDGGHPMVYAEWLGAPGRPTVLFYGHYDVQPVEPLEEWLSPPFEPTVRGENLYARGASDDKGQVFAIVKALESWLRGEGRLPLNVKLLIEGEEELGSPGLNRWIERHGKKVACDFAWVSDGQLFAPDLPTIVTGLRGLCYTEVEVRGASRDLHSGQHGGAAPNPLNALAVIIAGLKDRRGRVTVPRFYAPVKPPTPEEKASWERLPFSEEAYLNDIGATAAPGEEGYGILERRWVRPTLDVHGIAGGWTGTGPKTVIPAKATAKISMRLVPEQRAKNVFRGFEKRVRRLAPPGVEVAVRLLSGSDAVVVDPAAPPIQAAAQVAREVWGRDPVYIREGGSVPVVTQFSRVLKVPTVMFGFGLPDDNLHAPNEKFYLPYFHKGVETVIAWVERVGR